MSAGKDQKVDFIIIGCEIAGIRAAIQLAQAGRVLFLSKGSFGESGVHYAQGGIAAAVGEDDEVRLLLNDTLRAGDGLCREEAVRILVEEGPRQIRELIEWGIHFVRNGTKLVFASEGAHSRSRVLRAQGGSTGEEVLRALMARAKSVPNVELRAHAFPVDLLMEEGRVIGVMYLDEEASTFKRVHSNAVLVATGGLGQVYGETTNPPGACGDGVAMAFRAGALLSDLEFIQFHPTVLHAKGAPPLPLSEALRGEGAQLRNIDLDRFMLRYHEAAELAPRDVVSRAIVMEMQRCRSEFVYLDLTRLNPEQIKKHFTRIYETCLQYSLDITTDLIPVHPAAHYAIGGVATDLWGATTLKGLYAAGEVAATGVHGANYLASNSLLEDLVYGARAASAMIEGRSNFRPPGRPSHSHREAKAWTRAREPLTPQIADGRNLEAAISEVQSLMWEKVGIIRRAKELDVATRCLDAVSVPDVTHPSRSYYEHRNMVEVARLIASSARARQESRGVHYRADFPLRNDTAAARHSYTSKDLPVYFA